jgi:hypothetical protein
VVRVFGLLATLLWLATSIPLIGAAAFGQQTHNDALRATPAPQQVTIDGSLDDWDLSGEILICYEVSLMLDTHSVRTAAMYDRENLYLSFRFKDMTPMVNSIDPLNQPGEGWRSDAVQIRFLPATQRLPVHVDAYYYTDGEQPVVYIQYGNLGEKGASRRVVTNALEAGARMAFRKDPAGNGYVQELSLPWRLLLEGDDAPQPGAELRMGVEAFWGDPTGREFPAHRYADLINPEHPQRGFFWRTPKAWGALRLVHHGGLEPSESMALLAPEARLHALQYGTEGPVSLEYKIPADGYVTLVIEDQDGRRVRNLMADYPRRAGRNVDYWDGRDNQGRLVQPGTYRVRGLYHGEIDIRYEFSYGSPGNPPWPTGDSQGAWLANHTNPMDVLADHERVYVSAPYSEGPHALIALDYAGHKLWGGLSRWYGGFMARAGDYLYVVNDRDAVPARRREDLATPAEIELIRLDPESGREAPFPDGKSRHVVASWNVQKDGVPRHGEGATIARRAHNADWTGIQAQGLAALGHTLYVSLHFSDKLLKVDAETGQVFGEIPLPAPAGLTADGGHLLAISGTSVVAVDPVNGKTIPVIQAGLKAPVGLAVDAEGRIYVSDWADQMCVKVFSQDGKFLRRVGRVGGRPWVGPYDRQAMLLPRGISVDARGRLWVAEDDPSPRRVSVWNPDGSLAFERLGQPYYGGAGTYIFPDQSNRAFLLGNLVELDWQRGLWRILGTPWRSTHPDALLGLNYSSEISSVHHLSGRRFLVHSANRRMVMISEWKNGQAIPLAAVGPIYGALPPIAQHRKVGFEPPPLFAEHLWTDERMNTAARKIIPWFFQGPRAGDYRAPSLNRLAILRAAGISGVSGNPDPNNNFVWADLNGNGRIDLPEIRFYATPGLEGSLPPAWHPEPWSHGVADGQLSLYFSAVQGGRSFHWKLPIAYWAKSGAPMYEPDKAKLITSSSYLGETAWVNNEGNLLTYGNIANHANSNLRDPLVMYRPDGTVAWTYPSPYSGVQGSHVAPKARRGLLIGPLGIMGEAHLDGVGQIFALHTNMGQAVLFTADGLYLTALFQDTRSVSEALPRQPKRGMSLKNISNGGEWFGGQFFQHPKTGSVYVVGGRTSADISRVTGLESVQRLPTRKIEFTKADNLAATRLGPKKAAEAGAENRRLQIHPVTRAAHVQPPVKAFDWRPGQAASWRFDAEHLASATWSYDEKSLYLCFRNVQDKTPMVNSGEDPQQLFKFGDAALFELRTRANDESADILPGDLRLLLSVFRGKPIAVLYRYRVPEVQKPVVFQSVTSTRIDDIRVLTDAQIALHREADRYTLCATIPLTDLAFNPKPGKIYRGDFGIVYSDANGTTNQLRMYWANQATGLVDDLALEARIEPQRWGRFEVVTGE